MDIGYSGSASLTDEDHVWHGIQKRKDTRKLQGLAWLHGLLPINDSVGAMKAGPVLFRMTAIVIFIQLAIGGLLTFDFINATAHIITGFIVFILAIVTMILAITSKPVFKPIRTMSIVLVVLLL